MTLSRRNFLKTAAVVSLGAGALISLPAIVEAAMKKEANNSRKSAVKLKKGDVIMFQGDSITDNGRQVDCMEPNTPQQMGLGYVAHTAAQLLCSHPTDELKIYNRGCSGHKVCDLQGRWTAECLDFKPSVLSVLIGVNDFWHTLDHGYKGTLEVYRNDYIKLLEGTREALPNVQFVLAEPFAFKGSKTVTDRWYPEFDDYRAAAREVAEQFGALFIPYQTIFDEALTVAPLDYWSFDGVHATLASNQLMAKAWLDTTGL